MKLEFLESSVFSDSETLFKYKNWWSKCLQEIVLVHHFIAPFFPIQMSVQKFCHFLQIPESLKTGTKLG